MQAVVFFDPDNKTETIASRMLAELLSEALPKASRTEGKIQKPDGYVISFAVQLKDIPFFKGGG